MKPTRRLLLLPLTGSIVATLLLAGLATSQAHAQAGAAREFLPEAKLLLDVVACANPSAAPSLPQAEAVGVRWLTSTVKAHCKVVTEAQAKYKKKWLALAQPFFASHAPAAKTVIYPFAGGDLATALTVFPNAEEITTFSLEPAGDPRTVAMASRKRLEKGFTDVAVELSSLYKSNFSVTSNMMEAMRKGKLPTQLTFSLSALLIHDYELISMRFFALGDDGSVNYIGPAQIDEIDKTSHGSTELNRAFSNVELRFRKKGSTQDQVYRHIRANLDDNHLRKAPGAMKYMQARGQVAAMTKAASYLLSFSDFAMMRDWATRSVTWMVSDTTGLAPTWGKPTFEYETWGKFTKPNMPAGHRVTEAWVAEWAAQPKRKLGFRFGYPDGTWQPHLVIMKRKP